MLNFYNSLPSYYETEKSVSPANVIGTNIYAEYRSQQPVRNEVLVLTLVRHHL